MTGRVGSAETGSRASTEPVFPVSALTGFDPARVAAVLGKAQREVVLSLGEDWGKASSHQTAKRMFWGVRGVGGGRLNYYAYLVDHKHRTDNCWRLTERGVAVKAALAAAASGGDVKQAPGEAPQSGPQGQRPTSTSPQSHTERKRA